MIAHRLLALQLELLRTGAQVVRLVTELRAKHASGDMANWGVDGEKGKLVDMAELGIWEPMS